MNVTKDRQARCNLQVKLCDPCLSALRTMHIINGAIYIRGLLFLFSETPLMWYDSTLYVYFLTGSYGGPLRQAAGLFFTLRAHVNHIYVRTSSSTCARGVKIT